MEISICPSSRIPIVNSVKVFGLPMKLRFHESNLFTPTVIDLLPLSNLYNLKKYRKLPPSFISLIEPLKNHSPISNKKRMASHYWSKRTGYMQTNEHIISWLIIKIQIIFLSKSKAKVKKKKKMLKGNK